MNTDKDSIRADRAALEQALRDAGAEFKGKMVKCPFHDDRHPSGGIFQGEDGAWRFKCQTPTCGVMGDVFDIRARIELKTPGDLLKELRDDRQEPEKRIRVFATLEELKGAVRNLEACYVYTNPDTRSPEMVVLRSIDPEGKKRFIQCRPEGGGFVMLSPRKPWPIYNRTRVRAASDVLVVEGEKCVHALADVGVVATTSPGGAGKAGYADWSPLVGKSVTLWPDNDPADPKTGKRTGVEHMREVAEQLQKLSPPPRIRVIDPDDLGLPDKGDAVEYIRDFGGASPEEAARAVAAAVSLASDTGPADDLYRMLEDTIAGKRYAVPWFAKDLHRQSQSLLPGTVTAICGDPGTTKSLFLLEAAAWWYANGFTVAVYELEEDKAYHLNRMLAQLENRSEFTDAEWVTANPEAVRAAWGRHREFLEGFAPSLYAAPDGGVSYTDLLAWTEKVCGAGARVVCIDPITAADTQDKPWIEDRQFVVAAKSLMRKYGASMVLVTHPRGSGSQSKGNPLENLAGGRAFARFTQNVFWVYAYAEPKDQYLFGPNGYQWGKINRAIRIAKGRNARGQGKLIGYWFDPSSLRFAEQGIVQPESKETRNDDDGQP